VERIGAAAEPEENNKKKGRDCTHEEQRADQFWHFSAKTIQKLQRHYLYQYRCRASKSGMIVISVSRRHQ